MIPRRSLEIEEESGNEQGQAQPLGQLGLIAEKRGRREDAMARFRQAEAIVRGSLRRVEGTEGG